MATSAAKKATAKARPAAKPAAQSTAPENMSAPANLENPADVSETRALPSASALIPSAQATGTPQNDDEGKTPVGEGAGKTTKACYRAKTPINHDGTDYAAGDDVPLDDQHVEQLLAVGAIEDVTSA